MPKNLSPAFVPKKSHASATLLQSCVRWALCGNLALFEDSEMMRAYANISRHPDANRPYISRPRAAFTRLQAELTRRALL